MARLILETQISIDGFMAGPQGQTDWMIWNWGPSWTWDKDLQDFHTGLTLSASHIVISRQMAEEGFIGHWHQTAARKDEQAVFALHISHTPKTVISTTLSKDVDIPGGWNNVALCRDPFTAITRLKRETDGNILAYGGATLASALLGNHLVDELYLIVNPVAICDGLRLFGNTQSFQLKNASSFSSGIAVLNYHNNT